MHLLYIVTGQQIGGNYVTVGVGACQPRHIPLQPVFLLLTITMKIEASFVATPSNLHFLC